MGRALFCLGAPTYFALTVDVGAHTFVNGVASTLNADQSAIARALGLSLVIKEVQDPTELRGGAFSSMAAEGANGALHFDLPFRARLAFPERAAALSLRAHMLVAGIAAPHRRIEALAEVPTGVAAARVLGEHVNAVDALWRSRQRWESFHAAILPPQPRSRQYDR